MSEFKTVLVATDLSETSAAVFGPALSIAGCFGARLIVVYVVEDQLPAYMDEFTAVPVDRILEAQTERADRDLAAFLDEKLPAGTNCEKAIVHGVPHIEILRVAAEEKVDMIAIATHGRGFVAHALFGSTTERVVRKAPCPVLTVRGTGEN